VARTDRWMLQTRLRETAKATSKSYQTVLVASNGKASAVPSSTDTTYGNPERSRRLGRTFG
jgi:hypothetical protein